MGDERELRERMIEAVIGLDAEGRRRLEEELGRHPALEDEYDRLREAWGRLGDLAPGAPPPGARDRARTAFLSAVVMGGGGRRWWAPGRVAVGVLLLVTGGVAGFLAAGIVGVGADPAASAAPGAPDERPAFALLIRGGDRPGSEVEATEAMTRWAVELATEGRLAFAAELDAAAAIRVGGEAGGAGTDLPLGGFFIVRAEDRAEAARLARASPHLAWDGVVEVVPVVPDG